MTDAARDAARAHLAAAARCVEADALYSEALASSLRAAEMVGVAYEQRRAAQYALKQAFDALTAELRKG